MVFREEALELLLQLRHLQAADELLNAPLLGELLKDDLYEDARAGRCRLLGYPHLRQDGPRDTIRQEKVRKELPDVPQLVRLQAVHRRELNAERFLKALLVRGVDATEALRLQRKEAVEHALHCTTIYQHGADLLLLTLCYVQLEDLVHALLKVHRGHYHEIDGPPEVDKVLLCEVQDLLGVLLGNLLFLVLLLGVVAAAATSVILLLTEDLIAHLFPLCFVRRKLFWVLRLEDVQRLFTLDGLIKEIDLMCNLILLVY
mmetsp:Transcript_10555/g.24806  ORF Transcript_10555/g.24806 Transcript_10555/m.24806 type:complete len:259 (-) Transcript_10555:1167-1943(-)